MISKEIEEKRKKDYRDSLENLERSELMQESLKIASSLKTKKQRQSNYKLTIINELLKNKK